MGSISAGDISGDLLGNLRPRPDIKSLLLIQLHGTSWELERSTAGSSNGLADSSEIFFPTFCVAPISPFGPGSPFAQGFCGVLNYGAGFYSEFYQLHNFSSVGDLQFDPYDRRCGRITTSEEHFEMESSTVNVWTFNLSHTPDVRLCDTSFAGFNVSMKAQLRHDLQNYTKTLTYRWNEPVPTTWNPNTCCWDWGHLKFIWKTKVQESV